MANIKIQELTTETTLSDTHLLITEDGSSATSETKKTALSLLLSWIMTGNTFSIDLDELIEGNAITITKDIANNTATLKFNPPDWAPSTAYAVGDFVLSDNKFYKCNTAHTSNASIDTTKFTLIGGSSYTLPVASTSVLGGVKIDGTTITIDGNNVISANTSGTGTKWFSGDTAPTEGMNTNDYWLSTATATLGNVYQYDGTDWDTLVCNIRGAAGEDGTDGTDGVDAYVHIKYSANQPTQDSDMTDTPSAWMGILTDSTQTASTTYTDYAWYKIKGDNGSGGATIDDTTASTTTCYSSTKVDTFKTTMSADITLAVADWDSTNKTQTVSLTVDTSKLNTPQPTSASLKEYANCGVRLDSETTTGLTFVCETIPSNTLTFNLKSEVIVRDSE